MAQAICLAVFSIAAYVFDISGEPSNSMAVPSVEDLDEFVHLTMGSVLTQPSYHTLCNLFILLYSLIVSDARRYVWQSKHHH